MIKTAGALGLGLMVSASSLFAQEAAQDGGGARPARGERGARGGGDQPRPEMVEMTVTGTVVKEEQAGRDGQARTVFSLVDAERGKVVLGAGGGMRPRQGQGQGEATAVAPVKLDEFVGKRVTATGKGFQMTRGEEKTTRLMQITRIGEVVEAAPAPAPAAEEAVEAAAETAVEAAAE
jgi:hypothetical protein